MQRYLVALSDDKGPTATAYYNQIVSTTGRSTGGRIRMKIRQLRTSAGKEQHPPPKCRLEYMCRHVVPFSLPQGREEAKNQEQQEGGDRWRQQLSVDGSCSMNSTFYTTNGSSWSVVQGAKLL